ncbi:MAG: efflux RND transporter permease subunit [Burkholderiaceae bacterium]|nr:efflux RND transporter permease subunit [Burkholderiaceae bacterium]
MADETTPERAQDSTNDLPSLSIRRPWLVVVLNLLVVIAGLAALLGVEVRELPNIDRPIVAVRANYPGAAPETLDAEVTRLIEGAAARVPGVYAVRSASEEGNLRVIVEFRPDVDLVDAANDVREAVARVERELPEGIENLSIIKADADAEPVIRLAVSSQSLAIDELTRAIVDRIEPELVSVPGVADVTIFGGRERVLRVRLDPARLAALGLAVDDVVAALRTARADVPAGSLKSTQREVLVRANASLSTPEQIRQLQLKPGVKLAQVAEVYFSPADATAYVRLDGRTVVSLGIVRQAQSNSVAISDGVRRIVQQINARGDDLQIQIVSDDATFIRGSIREVLTSLALSVVIVVAVVGLFLGRWRPTLVPAVAIPVALIGTLGAIWLLGFSINLLTLLALVLASGLVVDDSIVVLENIQRRRGQGLGPRAAAVLGTREVFFAIVATTAALVSVFVPISFLPSTAGRLFTEFGFVMAIAVMLSSFVALSLGPMIAARLPAEPPAEQAGRMQRLLRGIGAPAMKGYERALTAVLRRPWPLAIVCLALAAAAALLTTRLPQELAPDEDRGVLSVLLTGPDGTGLPYIDRQLEIALGAVAPLQTEGLVTKVYTVTGRYDPNRAEIVAPLADWADRKVTQRQIGERVRRALEGVPGIRVRIRGGSSISGGGASDGSLRMAITGDEHARIATAAFAFAAAIERELPGLDDVNVSWNASQPQLGLEVDRERAGELGVSVEALSALLRAAVDGYEVSEISAGDRSVPVFVESSARGATDPTDLLMLQVRASGNRLVPLAQFVRFSETAVPAELERFGQRRAVEIDLQPADGKPLQQAIDELRQLAERELPPGMSLLFRGDAATLEENSRDIAITFAIALLVIFLVLVAQFESLASAAVVMLTVPFGLAAAVFAMTIGGVSLNLYSQIGLLLLVGVMAKNSILMVEFADQLRDAGRSVREAALEAAVTRLRPIMMTMSSTVLGALPLLLGSGAGTEARAAIGAVIFGGLSLAALFTLFLTPVIYLGLARFVSRRAQQGEQLACEMAHARLHSDTARSAAAGRPR